MSKNFFLSVGLAGDIAEVRPAQVKVVDPPIGIEFECTATSINDAGDTAYFLLNERSSHKTRVYSFDLVKSKLRLFEEIAQPYAVSQLDHI